MKLAKSLIKWSMLGVPVLTFIILVVSLQGSVQVTSADIAAFAISCGVMWILFSLILIGIIKLVEKMRMKHESQTD